MGIVKKASGLALALAAAALVGCATQSETKVSGTAELVQCHGVNKCGGHNDCKTANNACAGMASCKGQGFVKITAKACGDVGGTVK